MLLDQLKQSHVLDDLIKRIVLPFIAIEFREEKSLRTLSWPAQSPDLNPIANLWDEIKQSLKGEKKKPKNLNELERLGRKNWSRFLKIKLRDLPKACHDEFKQ